MPILKCIDSAVDLNEVSNGPKDFQRTQKHSNTAHSWQQAPPPPPTHHTPHSPPTVSATHCTHSFNSNQHPNTSSTMADEDEIAALVIDNGSGMCKGGLDYDDDIRAGAGAAATGGADLRGSTCRFNCDLDRRRPTATALSAKVTRRVLDLGPPQYVGVAWRNC